MWSAYTVIVGTDCKLRLSKNAVRKKPQKIHASFSQFPVSCLPEEIHSLSMQGQGVYLTFTFRGDLETWERSMTLLKQLLFKAVLNCSGACTVRI